MSGLDYPFLSVVDSISLPLPVNGSLHVIAGDVMGFFGRVVSPHASFSSPSFLLTSSHELSSAPSSLAAFSHPSIFKDAFLFLFP